jgi:cysteine desulfurase/selenocysteine lyase
MKKVRSDFYFFKKHNDLIFFDNAATSQKPQCMIDALLYYYTNYNAPIKRSLYDLAEQATERFEQARTTIARFINAQPNEIIFTSGATESINFIAATWGVKNLKKGDEIVLTELEHHSNLIPWQECAKKTGTVLKFIPVGLDGLLDITNLDAIITKKTKLISFLDVSNVLGTHLPVDALVKRAQEVGAKVFVDACQSVPHQKVDVKKYGCDFLAFSGHKMLGPTGIGLLYIKKEIQHEVPPYQFGGGMIFQADYQETSFLKPPYCYEAGTPPIAQAIGLAAAVDYLNNVDFAWLKQHEAALCSRLIEGLEKMPDIRILGPLDQLKKEGHLVSFVHKKYHFHDVAAYLNQKKICVRTGHYCAQPLASKLGIDGSIRASFYLYNTLEEVDRLLEALQELR